MPIIKSIAAALLCIGLLIVPLLLSASFSNDLASGETSLFPWAAPDSKNKQHSGIDVLSFWLFASQAAQAYLVKQNVVIRLNQRATSYDGEWLKTSRT